jgi:hypothetical protein
LRTTKNKPPTSRISTKVAVSSPPSFTTNKSLKFVRYSPQEQPKLVAEFSLYFAHVYIKPFKYKKIVHSSPHLAEPRLFTFSPGAISAESPLGATFVVISVPHSGARPSVRLCVGLNTNTERRTKAKGVNWPLPRSASVQPRARQEGLAEIKVATLLLAPHTNELTGASKLEF